MEAPVEIDTRACTFRFEGGIVVARVRPRSEMTLDDAKEAIRATGEVGGGGPRPVLVDMRGVKSQTRECREYFAGEDSARVTSACAILVASPVSRVLGNFFLAFNPQMYPTRLFSSEGDALRWLRSQGG